ncbi:MGDG synthase family glycosyltransferase [Bacillus thermotolerans]|uniref:Diglucosyldiacylglycerol synthase (LTA membrane anchor synthesis) n=1 Tax=Bacillus thermotolerans TaxID=1221996 RepID=A0A0F5I291_BACTR|nr:glycosyltransferase [Bacillus thermotolerans]KKB39779.1 diglucosyldiacylglycerol synthase (LTA membrane anchor synthesis) [Bacillus thermotolerans]
MKILLLPFFRMPSGHHKAAEAIISHLSELEEDIDIKTVDILSYFHSGIERVLSNTYLKWISTRPASYSKFYHSFMYAADQLPNRKLQISACFWDKYMEWRMAKVLEEEAPDLIICTHCYPSKLLNRLKKQRKGYPPVINVYTDFFINDIWGKTHIDFHFVPHKEAKEQLMQHYALKEEQVFITGIPIHPAFHKAADSHQKNCVLVAGGNNGLGQLHTFIKQLSSEQLSYTYKILCGNNKKLFHWVTSLQHEKIIAVPYTGSREQMNSYYEEASAIVTKPGGITITEVLEKSLPVFIFDTLPGQEEINMSYLQKQRLIYQMDTGQAIEQQITQVIDNEEILTSWQQRLSRYQSEKEKDIKTSLITILKENQNLYISSLKKSAFPSYLG